MWLKAKNRDNTGGSKMTTIRKDCLDHPLQLSDACHTKPPKFLHGLSACAVCSEMQTPVPESVSMSLPMSYLN